MFRFIRLPSGRLASGHLALAISLGTVQTTAAATSPSHAVQPPPHDRIEAAATEDVYGPIRAKDPLERARIKRLYLDLSDLHQSVMSELESLGHEYRRERDPDFRAVLAAEITAVKLRLERRNMEIGLEIARLNGDPERVAEFERALDALSHPERSAGRRVPEGTDEPAPRGR